MIFRRVARTTPLPSAPNGASVLARLPSLVVVVSAVIIFCAVQNEALAHDAIAQSAQTSVQFARARVQQLTLGLAQLATQYQLAEPNQRSQIEQRLLATAIARERDLLPLVEQDTHEVLRLALPAKIRASLPSTIRRHIEEEVDIEGTLEILHEDAAQYTRYVYNLSTVLGKFTVYFANADSPDHLLTGSRVRVKGVRVVQTLAADGTTTGSVQTLAAALPNTLGAQKTLAILVNFADNATQPYTLDYARTTIFTTTSNFDWEASYGQTSLTGDVVGWFTIPLSSAVCDYTTLATQAQDAARARGVNLAAYTRYVYAFPKNACGWSGVGTVGGNPSQAWINGKLNVTTLAHEMGHNLGLYHSHGYDCSSGVLPGCTANEYGDGFDVMGDSPSGHFNSFQKERLGWLNSGASPPIALVTTSGTYTIENYETPAGVKALKVLKSIDSTTGERTYYYLEYRQPVGFDTYMSRYPNVVNGILMHTAIEGRPNTGYLLDLTPPPYPALYDPGLAVGRSFSDPAIGLTIVPVWANGTAAGVNIAFGSQQCVQTVPDIAMGPAQGWAAAGATVTYTVTITNYDSSACPSSNFSLQASAASGWSVVFGMPTIQVAPGASAATSLTVTSSVTSTSGYYTITTAALDPTDPARSATASATYVIAPALEVTVSTDRTSYRQNQTATITTNASVSGAPAAGATVTVTLLRPNGTTTKLSATTDVNGAAVVRYRLKKQDPPGTYQALSVATTNTVATGNATASFLVQ